MLNSRTVAMAATLGIVMISPLAASAGQTAFTNAPVSVSACDTETTATTATASLFESIRPLATTLHYRFVNNAGIPAAAVTLDVSAQGQSSRIVDRGTFAPGIAIDRNEQADAYSYATGPITCRVAQVDFHDGTSWHAPAESKLTARR